MSNLPSFLNTVLYGLFCPKDIIIAGASSNIPTWVDKVTWICHYKFHYSIPRNYEQHRLSVSKFIRRQVSQWFFHSVVEHSHHDIKRSSSSISWIFQRYTHLDTIQGTSYTDPSMTEPHINALRRNLTSYTNPSMTKPHINALQRNLQ